MVLAAFSLTTYWSWSFTSAFLGGFIGSFAGGFIYKNVEDILRARREIREMKRLVKR